MQTAHYDTYDYPSYWKGRDYEHESEVIALKKLLKLIPKVNSIADIGAGFGRLTPTYMSKAKDIYLVEPSINLLNAAKDSLTKVKNKKISYVHSQIEDIETHLDKESLDAVLMVRVMHHMKDPKECIQKIYNVLKDDGFLLLEFANKIHGKAVFKNICSGDFTFPIDITATDRRCIENQMEKCIPFYNYHPDVIKETLSDFNFKILKTLSVSNVRSELIKKHIPFETLLSIEDGLQGKLASFFFGPSIFILAQKKA